MERLLAPVSDSELRNLVHVTMVACFVGALLLEKASGDDLLNAAIGATVGVLVCLSYSKILAHEKMPADYLRFGSYIMALGYSLFVINETVMHFVDSSSSGAA